MNKAIASVVTKTYCKYFEVLLHSYCKHNSEFPDWFVFTDDSIDITTQKRWESIYKGELHFRVPYRKAYADKHKDSAKFYIFEAFTLEEYDKVLALDADLLIKKDIKSVWHYDSNLCMHKETYRTCYNSGVMLIGKDILSGGMRNELLKVDLQKAKEKYFGNDQAIINLYFENKIFEIGWQYNCFSIEAPRYDLDEIKIIHYFIKPDDKNFKLRTQQNIQKVWTDLYNQEVKLYYGK